MPRTVDPSALQATYLKAGGSDAGPIWGEHEVNKTNLL